jgi:leader peptidase (prepilin peptidase)/N-methyltransferase
MDISTSMYFVNIGIIFTFGLIIGSFLNVVVLRMGSGRTLGGRSKCMSCGKVLKWYMLIPLFSFLFLRGRCGYCKAKLSMQYPILEAGTGLLVLMAAQHYGFSVFSLEPMTTARVVVDATALATLIIIAAYDLRHKIIPDQLSLTFALTGLLSLVLRSVAGEWPDLMPLFVSTPKWIDLAAAPLLALPLAAIWYFSKGKAMGLGDAKLVWGMAWFLGFIGSLSGIIFAFWIASIPSIYLLITRKGNMHTEMPFGPYLALATVLVYYFGWNVLNLSLSLV